MNVEKETCLQKEVELGKFTALNMHVVRRLSCKRGTEG